MVIQSAKETKNRDYIKKIAKKLRSVLVDGKYLTDEGVMALFADKDIYFYNQGLIKQDVTEIDFSRLSKEMFGKIRFSTSTVFPSREMLPEYFDPGELMKRKFKELKVSSKLNDKNVCMAIIDNPTQFYIHSEFSELNYELHDYSAEDDLSHFHMEGVLSNIASKNFGYAKDAKFLLYSTSWENRTQTKLQALKDIYKRIENGEKIQVVSISDRLVEHDYTEKEKQEFEEIVYKLKTNSFCKCEVIDAKKFYECGFVPIYCSLFDSPEDIDNYHQIYGTLEMVGVPTNNIMPEFGTTEGYIFEPDGGASWAIPKISYIYAYARTIKELSFEEFSGYCKLAANKNLKGINVLDFNKLIQILNNLKEKETYENN